MLVRRMPVSRTPVDRMLERFWEEAFPEADDQHKMALNANETDDMYHLSAELPGFNPEDIQINLHNNVLTISANYDEETEQEGTKVLLRERRTGKFERSVRFPLSVDASNVTADYVNGILEIKVPKSADAKPRQIPVSVNSIQG